MTIRLTTILMCVKFRRPIVRIIKKHFLRMSTITLLISLLSAYRKQSNSHHENSNSNNPSNETNTSSANKTSDLNEDNESQSAPEMTTEDITLKIMLPWDDDMFEDYIKDDVEKEFSNITVELISETVDAEGFDEVFAQKDVPDIVLAHNGYDVLKEYDMAFPLDDLIKENNYDLDRFRDGLIDIARSRDPYGEDQLYGLPFEDMLLGLFYNPEVFDLFGVDYPEDGMTWDEVLELARQVSSEKNGTTYRGLTFATSWHYSLPLSQLSVHGTDPETGEVQFDKNDDFTEYLKLIDRISSLPGNEEGIVG